MQRESPNATREALPSTLMALVSIARRLGLDVRPEQLVRQFSIDASEPPTQLVLSIARELRLEARALKVEFDDLPKLSKALPAILRARDGAALILEEAKSDPKTGTYVVVRDPSGPDDQRVAVEESSLEEIWAGDVILVKRRHAIADDDQPFGGRWLLGQMVKEGRLFREIMLAAFVSTLFAVAPPFVFLILVDRVLMHQSLSTLNVLTVALVVMLLFETVLSYVRGYLVQIATTRIDGRINLFIVHRLVRLPMNYFEHNPSGRILSKIWQATYIRSFLAGQGFSTFLDTVPLLGILPALFLLNWALATVVLILALGIFFIVLAFIKPLNRLHVRLVKAEQAKNSHLVETIHGIRTVKSLALEGRRRKEWDRHVAQSGDARHAFGLMLNHPKVLSQPLERLIYIGSMLLGSYMVLSALSPTGLTLSPNVGVTPSSVSGTVTSTTDVFGATASLLNSTNTNQTALASFSVGSLVAFAMLAMRLGQPLVRLASIQLELGELRGAIYELGTLVNAPPEDARPDGLKLEIKGAIEFSNVRFQYAPNTPYALNGVSFAIPPGTVLGIMGRSGSGKTTVTRLLQCLHSDYEGTIKIDGMDLKEIDLMHLRSRVGVVPQENFLFSGSIRENISMARPDATMTDVVRAAQLAGAEEFIEKLPRGYETGLEEGATNLSGGQRQRLAIARALLIDPPVLILDEATSALDAESEAIVNANLRRIAKGRTVISISHRLSTLVEADAIMVLEQGRVYDIGTHEDLLARCDIYRQLWYQQNRHLDAEASGPSLLISSEGAL
jgi:ATP-binding cassette subfamily B protein